jgi:hypothetical protein
MIGNEGWVPIQARFWLAWDTTALDAPFLSLGAQLRDQSACLFQAEREMTLQKIAMDARPAGPVVKT